MSAEIVDFQLDFFETERERYFRMRLEKIEALALKTKESSDKVRKKTFARIGEMQKMIDDINERLTVIERGLCCGSIEPALTL